MGERVDVDEVGPQLGWAVIPGADDYEAHICAFFPEFDRASAYVTWCQSDPDHDSRMTEPCIVAAALGPDGFLLANHYDYELGARELAKRIGERPDIAEAYIKEARRAMRRDTATPEQATPGKERT